MVKLFLLLRGGGGGFPGNSAGKESACNAGDPGSIPGSGRSSGEGIGYPFQYSWSSLVAQTVKNPSAMQETWVWSLGWEDPLEEDTASHSSILAWRIPQREEPGKLQSIELQRVVHGWMTFTSKCFWYLEQYGIWQVFNEYLSRGRTIFLFKVAGVNLAIPVWSMKMRHIKKIASSLLDKATSVYYGRKARVPGRTKPPHMCTQNSGTGIWKATHNHQMHEWWEVGWGEGFLLSNSKQNDKGDFEFSLAP